MQADPSGLGIADGSVDEREWEILRASSESGRADAPSFLSGEDPRFCSIDLTAASSSSSLRLSRLGLGDSSSLELAELSGGEMGPRGMTGLVAGEDDGRRPAC